MKKSAALSVLHPDALIYLLCVRIASDRNYIFSLKSSVHAHTVNATAMATHTSTAFTHCPICAISCVITRMWASVPRDGGPAEYRWRSVQCCKIWLTPTTRVPCSNAGKMQNPLKFAGVPLTPELISGVSGPKFTI